MNMPIAYVNYGIVNKIGHLKYERQMMMIINKYETQYVTNIQY
ncbi:hypothetical protein [Staphylococcus argensis]|nr:hypothetical protein [Staphylococcus argensis]